MMGCWLCPRRLFHSRERRVHSGCDTKKACAHPMAGTNVPRTTATTNCAPDLSLHSTVEAVASEERHMLFACLSTLGGAERRLFQHGASQALRRIRSPSRGLLSPSRSKFAGTGQLSTIRARILNLTWRYLRRCCCRGKSMSQKARHVHR